MSAALNAALVHQGRVAGTVQVFRLRPAPAATSDEVFTGIVGSYAGDAATAKSRVDGELVTIARNIRGSGLDLAAWRRGDDLALVTAYPARADLRAVAASII